MSIAAIWGTTVGYTETGYTVVVETIDSRIIVISRETFDHLYTRLDDFTAALKGDCIEYVVNDSDKDLLEYPEWFVDAVADGIIFTDGCGVDIFYDESGEIAMSPNSIILKNHVGDLRYMESDAFRKYYDTLEESQ
jgi:hypothetical protein